MTTGLFVKMFIVTRYLHVVQLARFEVVTCLFTLYPGLEKLSGPRMEGNGQERNMCLFTITVAFATAVLEKNRRSLRRKELTPAGILLIFTFIRA